VTPTATGRRLAELEREVARLAPTVEVPEWLRWATDTEITVMQNSEPFVPLLWLQVQELLGRVPGGSTARSREDGTLPD
jgi:hypothetical protein